MLKESKLLSFIDEDQQYILHFAEAQKIIHDLAIIHDLKGKGFAYFRDSVLSSIPFITLLKYQENLGLYIDSQDPYFLLKIEMSESGYFRTLLLPENFSDFPQQISGQGRLSKISVGQTVPYTSIIKLNNVGFDEVVNNILVESYQIKGKIVVSQSSDQCYFLMQLPRKNWDKEEVQDPPRSFEEVFAELSPSIEKLMDKGFNDESSLATEIESLGFSHLKTKDVKFKCSCSYERMVAGLQSLLVNTSLDDLYEDKAELETKCDYCKTFYLIPKSEFQKN
jgi:molecular chaperone Hsp33